MKIAIVLGTRPEIIKFSPVIRECQRLGLDYFILHTGQHYSYNMDKVLFEQLGLPEPTYNLDVGSGTHGKQTGEMLIGLEQILQKEMPSIVLVEGDTNTVLAGALVAVKIGIKVGHIEAGLRSYDRRMPEEVNRVLVDHCSDFLFAPTLKSSEILRHEGIPKEKVSVCGNTIVDAVAQNLSIANKKNHIIHDFGLAPRKYFIATAHRQENVDDPSRFCGIIEGLKTVGKTFDTKVIYPVHPRARKNMAQFGLSADNLELIEPLDYLSFLQLESKAKLLFTDSGGVQEETCVLKVPCVTLRNNTERPETLDVGANVLAGTDPNKIVEMAKFMVGRDQDWDNPFGDGTSSNRIIEKLRYELE